MVRFIWEFVARADRVEEFERYYASGEHGRNYFAKARVIGARNCCAMQKIPAGI